MTSLNLAELTLTLQPQPKWVREHGYAFLYWLAFLLILEPGNLFRAHQTGHALALVGEVLRIAIAAILGATLTPIQLRLTQRFPVLGPARWRHLPIHAISAAGLAFALIVASCVLAAWAYEQQWLPTMAQVRDQLAGNFSLLLYALAAYTAIAHVVHRLRPSAEPTLTANTAAEYLAGVEVKTRGRLSFLDLFEVDWIETQGNYLALHVGAQVHLVRGSLNKFEAQLNPNQFVRIHRRMIVAIDRIQNIQPMANGDAVLHLGPGRELRASRSYRKAVRERWQGAGQALRHNQATPESDNFN